MEKEKIIKKFLELNPNIKEEELLWRLDGRLEWVCIHGVGHTVWHPKGSDDIHGCDGCCQDIKEVEDGKRS